MYEVNYLDVLHQGGQGAAMGASQGGGWGALIGAGMGLLGGAANQYSGYVNANNQIEQQGILNQMQIKGNKELMSEQARLQYEMWLKTNYSAQVKEMKKAGLNPALIYKSAGGGGVTGNISSQGVSGGHASNESERAIARQQGMALQLNSMKAIAEIKNIEADTKVKETDAAKTGGIDTELAKAQIEQIEANIGAIAQETKNKSAMYDGIMIDNSIKKIQEEISSKTKDVNIEKVTYELEQIKEKAREIRLNNDITETSKNTLIDKIANENIKILSEVIKNLSSSRNLDIDSILKHEQTQKIIAETGITQEQLRQYLTYGVVPNNWISGVGNIVGKTSDMIINFANDVIKLFK